MTRTATVTIPDEDHMERIREKLDTVATQVERNTDAIGDLASADTVIREDIARLSGKVSEVCTSQAASSATLFSVAEDVGHIRARVDRPGLARTALERLTEDRMVATAALGVVLILGVLWLAIQAGLSIDTITASGWGAAIEAH